MPEKSPTPRLDALATARRKRGCHRCGETTSAVVSATLRRRGETGAPEAMLDSKQVSLCESCAVGLWPLIKGLVEGSDA